MNEKSKDMMLAILALALLSIVIAALVNQSDVRLIIKDVVTSARQWSEATPADKPVASQQSAQIMKNSAGGPLPHFPPISPNGPNLPSAGTPARPITPMTQWFNSDDYPDEALRNEWEGRVQMTWTVDESGRAVDCVIVQSSGHDVLDEAACRAVMARARYAPARDAKGREIRTTATTGIKWTIPE